LQAHIGLYLINPHKVKESAKIASMPRRQISYERRHYSVYLYIDSLEILQKGEKENDSSKRDTLNNDKDKYREMILDAAETVLGYFGFDRSLYGMPMTNRKRKWFEELREERTKDIFRQRCCNKVIRIVYL
jgi:hypothetical protein